MNRALHEALEADTATLGLSLTAHEADHLNRLDASQLSPTE